MSEKSLLILVDGDFVGGAETNYRYILPGLMARGWNAVFVCPDDQNLKTYFSSLGLSITTETGMKTYPPFSIGGRVSLWNILRVIIRIRRNGNRVLGLARELNPVAVISNSMVSHLLNASLPHGAGFKRVVHLHDIVDRRKAWGAYGWGLARISRGADTIVTISDAVVATLPEHSGSKTVKLYNPIETAAMRKRPKSSITRVGMFARYAPWKGHMHFLDLAERFSGKQFEFIAFGNISEENRDYFSNLRSRAAQLPNASSVSLNGFAPDPMQEMADCDVVVHLSISPEPFGRVLIEANACGVPIFAYSGGGVDELFRELNLQGQKFDVGDLDAMEQALLHLRPVSMDQVRFDLLEPDRYVQKLLNICCD